MEFKPYNRYRDNKYPPITPDAVLIVGTVSEYDWVKTIKARVYAEVVVNNRIYSFISKKIIKVSVGRLIVARPFFSF